MSNVIPFHPRVQRGRPAPRSEDMRAVVEAELSARRDLFERTFMLAEGFAELVRAYGEANKAMREFGKAWKLVKS